jgi:hypothetical protein
MNKLCRSSELSDSNSEPINLSLSQEIEENQAYINTEQKSKQTS